MFRLLVQKVYVVRLQPCLFTCVWKKRGTAVTAESADPVGSAWLQRLSRASWPAAGQITHVIAITSPIGCNTKILAGIFDMLNFMIMSLQDLATTCNNFRGRFDFILLQRVRKILACKNCICNNFTCTAGLIPSGKVCISGIHSRYSRINLDCSGPSK